jgi:hypothetical protein
MKNSLRVGKYRSACPPHLACRWRTQLSSWKGSDRWVPMIFKVMHMRGTVPDLASTIHSIVYARYIPRLEILLGSQKLDKNRDLHTILGYFLSFRVFPLTAYERFRDTR